MHFSERDFPKKFNKKISSNTDEQILVTVTQSVTNVPQTNNTSGMNEEQCENIARNNQSPVFDYHVYSRASLLCYPTMCYNKLVSKARKKWLQLSAIIYNTSNGDVRRLYYQHEIKCKRCLSYTTFVYYINKQILDSYLHTKSEKIWLLFTFVLN